VTFKEKYFYLVEFGQIILEKMEIGESFFRENMENYPMGEI
jgi:hypothetical protein